MSRQVAFEVLFVRNNVGLDGNSGSEFGNKQKCFQCVWRWSQSIFDGLYVEWEDKREINYGSQMFGLSNEKNIAFIFWNDKSLENIRFGGRKLSSVFK